MSSVRNKTTKGKMTAAEQVQKTGPANRRLLIGLLVLVALLTASAFVTRILYVEGY